MTFASQGRPCEALDRVEVDETDIQAIITLYQGRDPDDACDGPTQVVGVDVPLTRGYGPAGVLPYILAGITAETWEGPVVNGGTLRTASDSIPARDDAVPQRGRCPAPSRSV